MELLNTFHLVNSLGEDCNTSSDCNVHKGLCCKLHRRAKSRPKKVTLYIHIFTMNYEKDIRKPTLFDIFRSVPTSPILKPA